MPHLRQSQARDLTAIPVKHKWDQEADPKLIERGAYQLVELTLKFGLQAVVIPRPGCGNGILWFTSAMPA
jgi:hypothetical protein